MTTDYTKQANDFLNAHGIKFDAVRIGRTCPRWCNGSHVHGNQFKVSFSRGLLVRRTMTIDFWNSLNDARDNRTPEAYDVLAAITKSDPGDLAEFCSDFGYEPGPKARATYKAVKAEWNNVKAFFTEAELEAAWEIN